MAAHCPPLLPTSFFPLPFPKVDYAHRIIENGGGGGHGIWRHGGGGGGIIIVSSRIMTPYLIYPSRGGRASLALTDSDDPIES